VATSVRVAGASGRRCDQSQLREAAAGTRPWLAAPAAARSGLVFVLVDPDAAMITVQPHGDAPQHVRVDPRGWFVAGLGTVGRRDGHRRLQHDADERAVWTSSGNCPTHAIHRGQGRGPCAVGPGGPALRRRTLGAGGWVNGLGEGRRMEPETIGELIVRVRAELGLSQLGLAARLCDCAATATVTRHEISRWERGERIPTAYWLAWLAMALDRPVAELDRAAAAGRERRAASTPPACTGGGRPDPPAPHGRVAGGGDYRRRDEPRGRRRTRGPGR
jgi:hypothetical protein